MQLTKEIREDEDVISLTRVRTAMDVIKTNYGQEDVGTQIKVNMEITQIGYCETHKDVTLNIEMLDAYQAEKKAIAGMTPMTDMEMVQHLVSRFPKAKDRQGVRSTTQVFYENMLEEISMKQTADVKWTDVVEHRRAKLDIRRMMGEEEEEQETKKESEGRRKIRKLKRMMYGLDDASREWFNFVKETLVENEYKQCINDPCAFVKREGEEVCIVSVHVDDGTDLCNSDRLSEELYTILAKKFKITKQDCLEIQLGMTLEYNEDGSITVTMPVHIRKVIEEVYPEGTEIPMITSPMSEKWDEEYQRGADRCDIERWMMILDMVV